MSDILVRGMKMPRTCATCEWIDYLHPNIYCRREYTALNTETAKTSRPEWCPLVEVNTPHGDLIEKPKFLYYGGLVKIAPNDFVGIAKYFMDQINKQQVIIPAERSKGGY